MRGRVTTISHPNLFYSNLSGFFTCNEGKFNSLNSYYFDYMKFRLFLVNIYKLKRLQQQRLTRWEKIFLCQLFVTLLEHIRNVFINDEKMSSSEILLQQKICQMLGRKVGLSSLISSV